MSTEKAPSSPREMVEKFAPKLANLTRDVLFGEIWERPELSKRDRSLITVAALVALYRPDQLRVHVGMARENGVTDNELSELVTHLAFYTGWPNAWSAAIIAEEVLSDTRR